VLVWGALAMAGCAGAFARDARLPEWVTQAAASAAGHAWGSAKAVYLLNDTLVTVQPNGRAVERDRVVVKILRPEGRDYAVPLAGYWGDEKLDGFHVWSIGPDGHRYEVRKQDYVQAGDSSYGMLYQDIRYETAQPPGADPGGVVAWESTVELPSYFSEDSWGFQSAIPTVESTFEIDMPAGWHEYAGWARHKPVAGTAVAPNGMRWELKDIPGIDLTDVSLAPPWMSLAGMMTVHFSAKAVPEGEALWSQIGQWYYGLATPRSAGGPDITAAAQAAAGSGDFMSKLEGVARFMQQQVRYVGIEIGIGGWQPHPAEEIFQSRYGDCKDKATLMIAMLRAVGIEAYWVSVDDRRGVVDPTMPTLFGNHMIMAIAIPKGYENPLLRAVVTTKSGQRYLIFDPTNEYVGIGQIPGYEEGSYGVLAAGADSQLIHLPLMQPENNTVERTATMTLGADGTLTGEIVETRAGTPAWGLRSLLAADSPTDQRKLVEQMLRQDFSTFTLGKESVENVAALEKPLKMEYQVTAPLYAKTAGTMVLVRPRVVGSDAYGLTDKPRTVPISFDQVGTWKDDFKVKIPAGYTVEDLPDPVHVDAGFASYNCTVKATGGVLEYQSEYVQKKVTLPATDFAELKKLEGAITSAEDSDAVLVKSSR
jgi:hypothetical protein